MSQNLDSLTANELAQMLGQVIKGIIQRETTIKNFENKIYEEKHHLSADVATKIKLESLLEKTKAKQDKKTKMDKQIDDMCPEEIAVVKDLENILAAWEVRIDETKDAMDKKQYQDFATCTRQDLVTARTALEKARKAAHKKLENELATQSSNTKVVDERIITYFAVSSDMVVYKILKAMCPGLYIGDFGSELFQGILKYFRAGKMPIHMHVDSADKELLVFYDYCIKNGIPAGVPASSHNLDNKHSTNSPTPVKKPHSPDSTSSSASTSSASTSAASIGAAFIGSASTSSSTPGTMSIANALNMSVCNRVTDRNNNNNNK